MEVSDLLSRITYDDRYNSTPESNGIISDSSINDYVPFYSAFTGTFKRVGTKRFSIYCMPSDSLLLGGRVSNKTLFFISAFKSSTIPLTYLRSSTPYRVMKQTIFDESGEILYCLAIKSTYLFGVEPVNFNTLDYSKLVMLVNRKFETPENRLMYNFVKKEVITPLAEAGIDLVMTNSVTNWCLKSSAQPPVVFNTLSERREFLTNFNTEIIDEVTGRSAARARSEQRRRERDEELARREEQREILRTRAAEQDAAEWREAHITATPTEFQSASDTTRYVAGLDPIRVTGIGSVISRDGTSGYDVNGNAVWSISPEGSSTITTTTPTGETHDTLRELGLLPEEQPATETPVEQPIELPRPDGEDWSAISAEIDAVIAQSAEAMQEQELPEEMPWTTSPNEGVRAGRSTASVLGIDRLREMFYAGESTEDSQES